MDTNSPDVAPVDERPQTKRRPDARPKRASSRPQPKQDLDASAGNKEGLFGSLRRHPYVTAAVILVLLLASAAAIIWWLQARQYEWTDDAFIDARTVAIGAEIAGRITDVAVTDNQSVKAGDVLLRIDDRDYQASLKQVQAQVAQADAETADIAAQIEAQQAKVDQAQKQVSQGRAALDFAKAENQRNSELLAKGTGTLQQAQQAASTLRQAQATLDSSQANVVAAQRQVAVLEAQRKSVAAKLDQAHASEEQARTALSRTSITAPVAGRATNISAAVGAYAQPGQVLMMFVPEDVWVKANFKETQLDLMRPGQPVEIDIDAYPEQTFRGHVDSIQAGSGTAFSLLPAENATGNFVKVVQRVPVKIVFDKKTGLLLGPGMSVVPTVKVR
ncbi:HlyD family secretion protein [Mesorhizobium sp. BR1-1-14]|uniref:HlyD family secretion protein n=1 Tax=Mesorhizobium sp. BR1-1-14 TaxID=2876655 RepID=UPI001CD09075|nr:HlyD family secretion protein [Mesorhizobium sp. BR1-1-14]MBZ9959060.1 HlyD family secretion protein [Mesorhizobium sp. BR1-1-14]